MGSLNGNPVFCIQTKDKKTGRIVFINFKSTDSVGYPSIDLDEDQLINEIRSPSRELENFKIPMKLSQIYWSKEKEFDKSYVIDVHLNDKFSIRRLIVSDVIRHYVITVTLLTIEEKFNHEKDAKVLGQFVGHELSLDDSGFEILTGKQSVDKTNELVNNKITLIERPSVTDVAVSSGHNEDPFDLYYRPTSRILTCLLNTDKLPDSIGFNEDRIIVKLDEKILLDVFLPFFIDLQQSIRYKFDDGLCLLRIVFKVVESI